MYTKILRALYDQGAMSHASYRRQLWRYRLRVAQAYLPIGLTVILTMGVIVYFTVTR